MKQLKYGLLGLIFIIIATPLTAQIIFNEKGILQNPLMARLRDSKNYRIHVQADRRTNAEQMKIMLERIRLSQQQMAVHESDQQIALTKERDSLLQFFAHPLPDCADLIRKELARNFNKRLPDSLKVVDKQIPATPCVDEDCLCTRLQEILLKVQQVEDHLQELQHRKKLTRELFSDYSGDVFDNLLATQEKNFIITFEHNRPSLTAKQLICAQPDFLPPPLNFNTTYLVNKETLKLNHTKDGISDYQTNYKPNKKFALELEALDNVMETLLNWHNRTSPLIRQKYIDSLKSLLNAMPDEATYKSRAGVLLFKEDSASFVIADNILSDLNKFDAVWKPCSPIVQYLRQWYWYSGGVYELNYLNVAAPDRFQKEIRKDKKLQQQEERIKAQIAKIKSIIDCISCRVPGLDTLRNMQDSLSLMTDSLEKVQAGRKLSQELVNNNKRKLNFLQTNPSTLHELELPLKPATTGQYIIYHNALDEFDVTHFRKPLLHRKTILPESLTIFYSIMNASKPQGELTITEKDEAFDDASVFVKELGSAFKALGDATATLAPLVLKGNPFLGALGSAFPSFLRNTDESGEALTEPAKRMLQRTNDIQYKLWRLALLRKMIKEYDTLPTPGNLKTSDDEDADYYTYGKKAIEKKPPYTINYTISRGDKELAQDKFSIGRQKLITIGAGIFFNQHSARQQVVDSTNGITIKNTDNKAKFVAGIKIFPFKLFEADGSLIPRFPQKRLSFFAGFEVLKPLENLYTGVGYDLVPGLQVSAGLHFYRRDSYKLENNQVVDKSTTYKKSGMYYGVALDPMVLTEFLKSIFK